MAPYDELRAELLKDAETIGHPHVELHTPEHPELSLRLRLRSDDGPQWALESAAAFSRVGGWHIREVSSEGGQTFTIWLTVEKAAGRP
ncbi:hypothetical protein [Kitasatospora viridis]|uniref:Uncharacterized protein n=1 Tax=Kitasatospora viridis TaxID=281105 RepID=A0A561T716_9ACTN|nr:hypothetical protein [Kitasatospora viridis]TWF82916.1 hypothetical protein FHX73_14398 [Kitasatospora viridis]